MTDFFTKTAVAYMYYYKLASLLFLLILVKTSAGHVRGLMGVCVTIWTEDIMGVFYI